MKIIPYFAVAAALLAACSPNQRASIQATANRVVQDGQLFCAKATAAGPLVVALVTASSAIPLNVIGEPAAAVTAACAVINGIPVIPPPNPAGAPVVAVPVALPAKPAAA